MEVTNSAMTFLKFASVFKHCGQRVFKGLVYDFMTDLWNVA